MRNNISNIAIYNTYSLIIWTSISDTPKAPTAMLSHRPPNRQSPAPFNQVTRLPSKNASAPQGYPDARSPDIPVPQVSPIRYMFTCQKSQRSMLCNMVISGLTLSRVFRRRHLGRRVTAASDGPSCQRALVIVLITLKKRFIQNQIKNVFKEK